MGEKNKSCTVEAAQTLIQKDTEEFRAEECYD